MSSTILVPTDSRARRSDQRSSLRARLRQIEVQRGAFRNVTEASLKEIDTQASDKLLPLDETPSSEDEEDSQKQHQKKVRSATQIMLKQLE